MLDQSMASTNAADALIAQATMQQPGAAMQPPPPPPPVQEAPEADPESTLGKRLRQFIAIRDKISEVKKVQAEALKPFETAKAQLEAALTELLNIAGSDSQTVRGVGTVYRATESSATIADGEVFRQFVIESQSWDCVDWRANKTGVRAHIKAHQAVPPGVNFSQMQKIGVRRDSNSGG
jgi:hypothetical protein